MLSIFVILALCIFLYLIFWFEPEQPCESRINVGSSIGNRARVDCAQNVTYCFEDSHCAKMCQNATGSICRNGVCLSANIINSQTPLNECDARRGVVSFFSGNVALGRFDFVCRSIDLGVAPDDISQPNNMCRGGIINIDYTRQFPTPRDCQCPAGTRGVILPATSQVRQYVQCLPTRIADTVIT